MVELGPSGLYRDNDPPEAKSEEGKRREDREREDKLRRRQAIIDARLENKVALERKCFDAWWEAYKTTLALGHVATGEIADVAEAAFRLRHAAKVDRINLLCAAYIEAEDALLKETEGWV